MRAFPYTPQAGDVAWVDYIPVRFVPENFQEGTYNQKGFVAIDILSTPTGKQAWVDYVPVVIDDTRTDAWLVNRVGYIPVNYSGTGDGTAANKGLSLNFLGADRLDPRITFSRASNATVTNSSGNIVYAPHNLLTFSEQFDNAAWFKSQTTVTANDTVAPDGTTTSDKVVEAATTATHAIRRIGVLQVGTQTASVYLKAGERSAGTFLVLNGATAASFQFDLSTGQTAAGATGLSNTYSMVSVGDGWYRLSITFTPTTTPVSGDYFDIRMSDVYPPTSNTGTSYAGDGTSGIFIWGAQLNVGSLQSYNPTTVKNLLGFSEQFDNAAWTKSNSFIQTNLLVQSEGFDLVNWSKSATTVTNNAAISPRGTQDADKIIATSVSGVHYAAQVFTGADNTTYTFSFYAKASEYNQAQLNTRNKAGSFRGVIVSLVDGSLVTVPSAGLTVAVTSVGNDWYRISGAFDSGTGATTPSVYIYPATGGSASFTGDDVSGIFIWGAQLVQGSVAGNYQQTTSSALAVQYQDPNGTMTADKLVENTAAGNHVVQEIASFTTGTTYSYSVYAKAGERTSIRLLLSTTAFGVTIIWRFNLINGTTTPIAGTSGTTATMTNVGNGWWRCAVITFAATATATSSPQIYLENESNLASYTGDGTSGIYVWGAQLSDSASLDQYVNNPVAAPSSTAYYGPRFDYDPVTLQPRGLLIEEQRSNLLVRSEEFNTTWTATRSSVVANAIVAPDGTLTGDKLVEDTTASNTHFVTQTQTATATTTTFSCYAKAGERTQINLHSFESSTPSNPIVATFDLLSGTVVSKSVNTISASITPVGNGWYRCVATGTTALVSTTWNIRPAVDGNVTYTGDGTSGIYIWGAQLEAGAFPTSYIPTTTAQVTRSADVALIQGSNFSSWYNPNESTIFVSPTITSARTSDPTFIRIDDGTDANRVQIGTGASFTVFNSFIITSNVSQGGNTNSISPLGTTKVAFGFTTNSSVNSVNGSVGTTDTSVAMPSGINRLLVGSGSGTSYMNGHIRQVAYYPRRLQNSELVALTS